MKYVVYIFMILVSCLLSSIVINYFDYKQGASKFIVFLLSITFVYVVFNKFLKNKYPLKDKRGAIIKENQDPSNIKKNKNYFDGLKASMLIPLIIFICIGIYTIYKYFEYYKFNSIRGFIGIWFILFILFIVFSFTSYFSLFNQIKF